MFEEHSSIPSEYFNGNWVKIIIWVVITDWQNRKDLIQYDYILLSGDTTNIQDSDMSEKLPHVLWTKGTIC